MEPIKTLGTIIDSKAQRDAIHIAIAPVTAHMVLRPGQHVGIDGRDENPIGVVDPFLTERVKVGEVFWMFLYPNTITGLRHEWAHPSFETGRISRRDHMSKSELWIADHADELGLSYDAIMGNAAEWLAAKGEWGNAFVQQGSETWRDNFRPTDFWHHYEIVTGTVVPEGKKESMYCCSC